MKNKLIRLLGLVLISSILFLCVVTTSGDGDIFPPYGQATPASNQVTTNV